MKTLIERNIVFLKDNEMIFRFTDLTPKIQKICKENENEN